ncbi:MerR family DNA-binding transcriptional regulator, partial [Azorhizophilus paspali]
MSKLSASSQYAEAEGNARNPILPVRSLPRAASCDCPEEERALTVLFKLRHGYLILSNMDRLVGIGEAAKALGVSITTLRRWEASG